MTLEEEIYAVLVERFGVGEICIKKWRTRKEITWLQFIKLALEVTSTELPFACGYEEQGSLSRHFINQFKEINSIKVGRQWKNFLFSLLDKKYCYACGQLLTFENFNKESSRSDGLQAKCTNCTRDYRTYNIAKIHKRDAVYRELNKERLKAINKIYYICNKPLYTARAAKYRATKLKATPNWANLVAIKEIYATCPEGYHVDHIIPLQNDIVCGLHCEFNLQHLSAHDNLSKGNKYEP